MLGYTCVNHSVTKTHRITKSRINKKIFLEGGLPRVVESVWKNLKFLRKLLEFNIENDIHLYRWTDIFPFMSDYEFESLPEIARIMAEMSRIGSLAKEHGQRWTNHPGPFCVLASPRPEVVKSAIQELNQTARINEMFGFDASPYYKINIHIGGNYKNKQETLERFCRNFERLSNNAQKALTIENDDKQSGYTIKELYDHIHKRIGIPIVFDYHHHDCYNDGMTEEEAVKLAASTWPQGINPIVHMSSSRQLEQDGVRKEAHASRIFKKVNTYGLPLDIMLESSGSELALLDYRRFYGVCN